MTEWKKVFTIQFNERQLKIIDIVKENQPITSESIATNLNLTRATLRSDLAILTMTGILYARPKVGYFYVGINGMNLLTDQINNKTVGDIMSSPILVTQDTSIYDTTLIIMLCKIT